MTLRRLTLLSANLVLLGVLLISTSDQTGTADAPIPDAPQFSAAEPEITGSAQQQPESMAIADIGLTLFRSAILVEPEAVIPVDPIRAARLIGVIDGRFNQVAIVLRATDERPIRLRKSGFIDGWRVVEIKPKSMTLERDGEELVLRLDPRSEVLGNQNPSP